MTNLGSSTASNVVVSDLLPTNVVFVSASSGGTNGNGTVTWPTLTNFANAATTNFTVTVTAPASGSLTNTASSTSSTADSDASNNNGSAAAARVISTITPSADVGATVLGPSTVLGGGSVVYTISVTNLGPSSASNVVVTDRLSGNATFVGASDGGSHSNGVVTWPAMASLSAGAVSNFTVTVTAPSGGTLTNTVSSAAATFDPAAANNDGSAPAAQVITEVTPAGVNVSGCVYRDANKNGFKDTDEAGTGLLLYAKLLTNGSPAGPALQAQLVNTNTGAYTLTNVLAGAWLIVIDNNSDTNDVTPTLPSGWTGLEMPDQIRRDVAVSSVAIPNQNFGLIYATALSGKVFQDTGAGGSTANNGAMDGGESGLAGVAVKLTDNSGATTYDTATTDGGGRYTLHVPGTVANGAALKVVETNPGGRLSTGASAGNTGGSYDRASDTISFSFTSGTVYTEVNFGDVPENSFVAAGQQTGSPGSFVVFAHTFTAGSEGQLALVTASQPNPSGAGWNAVVYRDANCNGALDAGEPVINSPIAVTAGEKICLVLKEFIPHAAPLNARDQLAVTAILTYSAATPALTNAVALTDLATVGLTGTAGLTLLKSVDKDTALPGETITYTIAYENRGAESLSNVIIYDQTPAYTTFVSAANGALPNNLASVAIINPAVGAMGAVRWTFTGTLMPGGSGRVTYSVTVTQ